VEMAINTEKLVLEDGALKLELFTLQNMKDELSNLSEEKKGLIAKTNFH
jgi:hypothetical protein